MQSRGSACELRIKLEMPRRIAASIARALSPDCKRLPRGLRVEARAKGGSLEASFRARDAPSLLNAAEDLFRCAEAAFGTLAALTGARQTFFKHRAVRMRPSGANGDVKGQEGQGQMAR